MNKNAIQKYAVWARNELIEQIKQRAYQYGISEKSYGDENASVIAGRALSLEEMRQRKAFVAQIKEDGLAIRNKFCCAAHFIKVIASCI